MEYSITNIHDIPADHSHRISLKYSAAAGSIAEEVISTVRTAHAFGTQETLADVYDGPIDKSRAISLKSAIWQGGGMAVLLFVIYSGYALGESIYDDS